MEITIDFDNDEVRLMSETKPDAIAPNVAVFKQVKNINNFQKIIYEICNMIAGENGHISIHLWKQDEGFLSTIEEW